jgi:glycosyltransferase involved in cell wall biosynthesis
MSSVRISVIIPTRNRETMLLRCLDGLLCQLPTRNDFEVLIGDDFSDYDVARSVEGHALSRNVLIRVMKGSTRGAANARNTAASVARGQVLAFLDDDAVPHQDWLLELEPAFKTLGPNDAITGRILPLQDCLLSRARQARYDDRRRRAIGDALMPVSFLAGGNFAIRTEVFRRLGGFRTDFRMMHDGELLQRLQALGGSCYYVDKMVIDHTHVKTTFDAFVNAFRSGKYRVMMARQYTSARIDFGREWSNGWRLLIGGQSGSPRAIQAINGLLQFMHLAGVLSFSAMGRKPAPPAKAVATANVDPHP